MQARANRRITPDEYLEADRTAPIKSEYLNGEVFAMVGASANHNLIAANLTAALVTRLAERGCRVFGGDMRLKVAETGLYTYPALAVVGGVPEYLDDRRDTLLNPDLIVEILSPTTEAYDRGMKFELYRRLPSLQGYLLVAQDRHHLELFTREAANAWVLREASGAAATLAIEPLDCAVPLAEVYRLVELEALPA